MDILKKMRTKGNTGGGECGDGEWTEERVILSCRSSGLGIEIGGGKDNHLNESQDIFIRKVEQGGAADVDGRLRVGDVILKINKVSLTDVTYVKATNALRSAGNRVKLVIKRKSPHSNDPRAVEIELKKGDYGFGFSIAGGIGNEHIPGDSGIFIIEISEGGPAHADGRLAIGDKLIAVRNTPTGEKKLENITHEEAVAALKSAGNRVILKVSKPDPTLVSMMGQSFGIDAARTPPPQSQQTDFKRIATPPSTKPTTPTLTPSTLNTLGPATSDEQIASGTTTGSQSRTSVTSAADRGGSGSLGGLSGTTPRVLSDEDMSRELRSVTLVKGGTGLGLNIVGGEYNEGIFISFILAGGPADQSGQLRRGDQVISVNGVDLTSATHEEAAHALKNAGEIATLLVVHKPEEYNRFEAKKKEMKQHLMSGSMMEATETKTLFLRALNDFDPTKYEKLPSCGLAFQFGEILHVTNGCDKDWWEAKKVLPGGQVEDMGIIPSKKQWEMNLVKATETASVVAGNSMLEKASSLTNLRKSFSFSKKFPFVKSRSSLAEGCEDEEDGIHTGGTSDLKLTYEGVKKAIIHYVRPVIIIGPMKEYISERFCEELAEKFEAPVPHTTRPPREDEVDGIDYHFVTKEKMESEMKNSMFISAGKFKDHLYGISFASVHDVSKKKKHCLFDVGENAIKRIQAANVHPIIIFIRAKTSEDIMDADSSIPEEEARLAFERARKIEKDFSQYFTAKVDLEAPEELFEKVKTLIAEFAGPEIWIPSNIDF